MLIQNNPWFSSWQSAQPVPAHRQKRLFNDTREAEKTLHYLSSRKIDQIVELILPTLLHTAYFQLSKQNVSGFPDLLGMFQNIQNKLQIATKPIHPKLSAYEVYKNFMTKYFHKLLVLKHK